LSGQAFCIIARLYPLVAYQPASCRLLAHDRASRGRTSPILERSRILAIRLILVPRNDGDQPPSIGMPFCGSSRIAPFVANGPDEVEYRCRDCGRRWTVRVPRHTSRECPAIRGQDRVVSETSRLREHVTDVGAGLKVSDVMSSYYVGCGDLCLRAGRSQRRDQETFMHSRRRCHEPTASLVGHPETAHIRLARRLYRS
jgi:hypothetical protein